jgi:RNA polymerase subunit RPABC4/transcription elongation factor Spt4
MKKLLMLMLLATTCAQASNKQDWADAICRINATEASEIARDRDAGIPMTEASDHAIKFMADSRLFVMSPKVNDAIMAFATIKRRNKSFKACS